MKIKHQIHLLKYKKIKQIYKINTLILQNKSIINFLLIINRDGFNLVLLQGHVKENRLKGSGTDKNILEFLNKQFNKKNREKAGTALSKRSNHSLAFRMVSTK